MAGYSESFARQGKGRSTWFEETLSGTIPQAKLDYLVTLPGPPGPMGDGRRAFGEWAIQEDADRWRFSQDAADHLAGIET